MGARESLEGCFEVVQPQLAEIGCTWVDFLWAVQVRAATAHGVRFQGGLLTGMPALLNCCGLLAGQSSTCR